MSVATILAIDTATELCSVALWRGEQLIERTEAVGQKHSARVLPLVDEVLQQGGVTLSAVDAFAFGAGPGSFTGLRIACGVVQGLAYGSGRPVVGVGNLRALAASVFVCTHEAPARLLVAIDARMHEAYCAVYDNDAEVSEVSAPALASPAALAELARTHGVDGVAGNALAVFPAAWSASGAAQRYPDAIAGAGVVARLARADLARGLAQPAAAAMPVYVRDRVALTIDERRAGASL